MANWMRQPRTLAYCTQCGKPLNRLQRMIERNERHFCNRLCRGAWQSENWEEAFGTTRKEPTYIPCKRCGKPVRTYPSVPRQYCSPQCANTTVEHEPTETELRHLYLERKLSLKNIGQLFNCGPTAIKLRLVKYDIPIRAPGWHGKLFLCKDGHKVRSTYEQRVDDWLYVHDLSHEYEPKLPFEDTRLADFYVSGYYIEVWGVRKQWYKERKREKLKDYEAYGLQLISLHEWDFDRRAVYKRKLAAKLVPQTEQLSSLKGAPDVP